MTTTSPIPHLSLTRALLVDRDADTRQMYGEFLRRGAYEIEEAEDGREALAKALTSPPDIIVTETRMPGIGGCDLCRLLRQDPLTRHIPIVVVTGDAFESAIRSARQAGADAVLVKPCLPERLAAEMLRVITASGRTRDQAAAAPASPPEPPPTRSSEARQRSTEHARRTMLCRAHRRGDTTTPPTPAAALVCPTCDQPLKYVKSHVGGVSARHMEQWDYYECTAGCGTFQYRQRTRRLRRVV